MEQIDIFEGESKQEQEKEAKAYREARSLELIADFNEEGFAEGWYFAVDKAFKDQLDIKYMERKEPVLDENGKQVDEEVKDKDGNIKKKKDGTPSMRKKTKAVMRWTQGRYYSFAEGHVVYDTPKGYLELWKDSLKQINLRLEVVRATPNTLDSKGKFINGFVTFTLSKPNPQRTGLVNIGQYDLNQTEFVEFLKTGKIKIDLDYLLEVEDIRRVKNKLGSSASKTP